MVVHKILSKLMGDPNEKFLKTMRPYVEPINEKEEEFQKLSEEQLKAKTEEFKKRLKDGETLDDIMVETFAVVKNACRRLMGTKYEVREHEVEWDMIPYDVQLIGAVAIHRGMATEMKTGEGKTLVCTLAVYLNALLERGVYLVTVNDYLAQRDAEWMGHLYKYLGLSVGVVIHGLNNDQKKEAYSCDITYGTNNEFGFDYLRDNMATKKEDCVQRDLYFAIVDEVDSILIDEARTPLIISAPAEESTAKYVKHAQLIPQLTNEKHYKVDEKTRSAILTEEGIKKMEQFLGMENIYTEAGFMEVHHIEQALKAMALFKKDVDYMVKDGEVMIIDEFTGRLMPGRRYSEGLHQAIEAKEKVEVRRESKTLASVSLQNYFRLFEKLSGMTGTAMTEAEEFEKIYGLRCVEIPTNLPITRKDLTDAVYKNVNAKFIAITKKVKELNEKGQPMLVGTISVENSEILSQLFTRAGIKHNVLNAKHHEKEAEIVMSAGQKGAVTIATNMAGRGTDIKLGEGVKELGGLYVLGSERHESRRIDNQLRGRSGRQGDPGMSQFYVAMTDELMRLFGGDRMNKMMEMLKVPDDMPIENPIISRTIESAQKRVEGRNFDIRKHLVEYDDVMNKHREKIYKLRRSRLTQESLSEEIRGLMKDELETVVMNFLQSEMKNTWQVDSLLEHFQNMTGVRESDMKDKILASANRQAVIDYMQGYLLALYDEKKKDLDNDSIFREIEKHVYLRAIDALWMDHIDEMSQLRQAVSLRGYGQRDPLIEYKTEAYESFQMLHRSIQTNTVITLLRMDVSMIAAQQVQSPQEDMEGGTNVEEVEDIETGDREFLPKQEPKVIRLESGSESHTVSTSDVDSEKVGRNDPCPCGSGKKYKKCCGA